MIDRDGDMADHEARKEAVEVPQPSSDEMLRRRVAAEVEALGSFDIHELRRRWRKLFRAPPLPHLPKWLLYRVIAYRVQANAFGDLDKETARFLASVAKERKRRIDAGEPKPAVPHVPPVPQDRSVKHGTILAREHDGVLHRVVVMQDGFAWEGKTYRSLSEVARAITGTNWNGPRFFGLRDPKAPVAAPHAQPSPPGGRSSRPSRPSHPRTSKEGSLAHQLERESRS